MNITNIDIAIEVMKRNRDANGKLDMVNWQTPDDPNKYLYNACDNEKELHKCGMAACLGGYLAVTPEWEKDGGFSGRIGVPFLKTANKVYQGTTAIACWLDIDMEVASLLCATLHGVSRKSPMSYLNCRNEHGELMIDSITFDDVIEELEKIKSGYYGETKFKDGTL